MRHWLETALRRTALPFALTAVIVSTVGWGMALYAPEAHAIGDVISHSKQGSQVAIKNPKTGEVKEVIIMLTKCPL